MTAFYVAKAKTGHGLFASKAFKRGEKITRFTGPKLTYTQVAQMKKHANTLQVGPESYIDLQPPGVYANHSCNPNAGLRSDRWLVALKNIKKGEEVTWDYSTSITLDTVWRMKCKCGAKNCRKYVSNFGAVPEKQQKKYIKLGVVQRFLL